MKAITIVAIVLLATANCVSVQQKYPFDYSKKRSIMAVMMEVEAKLKTKSPLDAILNVLTDFRDAVNTEQVNHDEIYHSQSSECASENEFRNAQVTDATTVLRDSSAQLTSCENIKIKANNELEVNEQQTFANEEHLRIVLSQRDAEESLYARRQQDYADAIGAVEEAQDILATIYSGSGSFIEVSKIAKKMIQQAINIKQTTQYAPVLAAFAQLGAKERQIDESALERVASLLETLRKGIKNAFDDQSTANADSVEQFNEQKERLEGNLERLATQEERLNEQVEDLNQCIGTQSAIVQTAQNKLSRNQGLWDQAQALCATFDNEYNYATQSRRQELQLVAELEEMVEQRFAQVDDENAERQQRIAEATD